MKCPFCAHQEDKVVDSRSSQEGTLIRRRRECLACHKRFTTYERIEEISLMVIKKDGGREPFDRQKILTGVVKACEKRPVGLEKIEELVSRIEQTCERSFEREVNSSEVGELVMRGLAQLDEVAYVRFASVYRHFKDINQFMEELKGILAKQ